jgi:hypothetical protein
MSQARFQKMQREKARREKAAEKKERKAIRADEAAAAAAEGGEATGDQSTVLTELAALHEQFEAGTIEFEEFEERKSELLGRLAV